MCYEKFIWNVCFEIAGIKDCIIWTLWNLNMYIVSYVDLLWLDVELTFWDFDRGFMFIT